MVMTFYVKLTKYTYFAIVLKIIKNIINLNRVFII